MCITEYKEELHLRNVMAEGEAKGRAEGEARMSKLVNILVSLQRYEDLKRVSTDEKFRNECYVRYNI